MIQTPYFPLSVASEMTIIPMNKLNMYNTVLFTSRKGHGSLRSQLSHMYNSNSLKPRDLLGQVLYNL